VQYSSLTGDKLGLYIQLIYTGLGTTQYCH